jgi:quinol monooxygenase YgiN
MPPTRKKAGCRGGHHFRTLADPNDVVILFEWESFEAAKKFSESEDLKTTMKKAGVLGRPDIVFLDDGDHFPV